MGVLPWKTLRFGVLMEIYKPEVFHFCFLIEVSYCVELALICVSEAVLVGMNIWGQMDIVRTISLSYVSSVWKTSWVVACGKALIFWNLIFSHIL